jgi:Peptide N-acetyl-beta-D-glucosaminyl asparaginase amidase A
MCNFNKALDLPTYYIDLTPFVPILTSGSSHNITLDVASAESNHSINSNWIVSANLQVVTGASSEPTTGNITAYAVEPFAQTATTASVGNGELNVTLTATRQVHIEADIVSGSGEKTHVVWSQDLTFFNTQFYLHNTLVQVSDIYLMPSRV